MAKILFWNTNRKAIDREIAILCKENDVDLVILAEYHGSLSGLLLALNTDSGQQTYIEQAFNFSDRLTFVTRYPVDAVRSLRDDGGISVRVVRPPIGIEILVVAVHFPSKLHRSDAEQTLYSVRVAQLIQECEELSGHTNSLIIGDLNMDPFEDGVISSEGLHGVMDKNLAAERERIVDGEPRRFFYNPMWNFLGDETLGPPGTYFRRGGSLSRFWHTFDQVLLRPSMLPYYSQSSVRVVTRIGGRELVTNGRIDNSISDHLPILVGLALEAKHD